MHTPGPIKATPEQHEMINRIRSNYDKVVEEMYCAVSTVSAMSYMKLVTEGVDEGLANAMVQEAMMERMIVLLTTIAATQRSPFGGMDLEDFRNALNKCDNTQFLQDMNTVSRASISAILTAVTMNSVTDPSKQEMVARHLDEVLAHIKRIVDSHAT